jgi:predicted nuclease of predicted toxin-antitoxin system
VNFVADENIDRQIVDMLRSSGHQVVAIAEMNPGISDSIVLDSANQTASILLTADKDFGELVFRQRQLYAGIVLVRLAGQPPDRKAAIVNAVVKTHADELVSAFTVVSPGNVRIRRAPAR